MCHWYFICFAICGVIPLCIPCMKYMYSLVELAQMTNDRFEYKPYRLTRWLQCISGLTAL